MKIVVFASGNGSNFQALVEAMNKGQLGPGRIDFLCVDNPNAYALQRAKKLGIEAIVINPKEFNSRKDYEDCLINLLNKRQVELVVLAGYMRILSAYFVNHFLYKIINIHPSLLPAFKGKNAIGQAYAYGVKVTGVTVHFVDQQVDHGPIILQQSIPIEEEDNLNSLESKIHQIEHQLYPKAIKLIAEQRVRIEGRKVFIQ